MLESAPMPAKSEKWVYGLVLASAASLLVSIAAGQALLAAACLLWVATRPAKPVVPGYLLPVAVLLLLTVVSLVASPEPDVGFGPIRKFVLFAMGIAAASFIRDEARARVSIQALVFVAAAASAVAVVQFGLNYSRFLVTGALEDDPTVLARVTGLMGHWMTFSGEQLIVWCAALPAVSALGLRRLGFPLTLIGASLLLSFTRSVWIGAAAGLLVAAMSLGRRQLMLLMIPLGLVGLAMSGLIAHRVSMSMKPGFGPDSGRIALMEAGLRMIQDRPWTGVGPEMISREFPKYYGSEAIEGFYYGHLHNNFLQIAAERGLPALGAFLWLIAVWYRTLWKNWSSPGPAAWAALSALAALTGFLVAGLFEYNFGDSEVLLLLLFIVSVPAGLNAPTEPWKART